MVQHQEQLNAEKAENLIKIIVVFRVGFSKKLVIFLL